MKKAALFLMSLLLLTMISACRQTKPATTSESGSVNPESEPYSTSESRTEDPLVVTSSEPISSSETEATDPSTSELPEEQSPDSSTSHSAPILQSPTESEAPSNTTAPTDFKDYICPDSMEFEKDFFKMGNRYGRVLFLRDYASYIKDSMVAELTDLNRNLMQEMLMGVLTNPEMSKAFQEFFLQQQATSKTAT